MALFEVTKYDRKIYEEELRDFLPPKMIDIHCHVWRDGLVDHSQLENPGEKRTVTWPSLVALDDPIEDLVEAYRLLFPGQSVTPLMFANAGGMPACNEYTARCSEVTGFPALYFSHPLESADTVEENIRKGHFLGVKSYLDLSPKYIPENEIRIFDFFPKHQLERLNELGAIMMLHIPRPGRLKDPVNLMQIAEIKRDYPNIRLIIAHIGRAYTTADIGNAFDTLDKLPDLMYDFCANCCEYAITEVLRHAGPKHLMFGTDMPITRMRMRRIEENGTYINLIPPGLYGDPSQDPHLREVSAEEAERITFFAYEEILALKRACKTLNLDRGDVEDIFYNNARALIDGAERSIYGE